MVEGDGASDLVFLGAEQTPDIGSVVTKHLKAKSIRQRGLSNN